ncbi:1-deoxy-D-xylulose-5-phosphate synthase [Mycolicibacterium smegmatis MKD8]|uniref:1-deoxy-D-xylulose-5-phosphate synthase n=1 Tax=Mycolicibacterium smegmatis (strain MKD8) TaxID=1214915 RepID=A0A2U9PT67_MYCSE|nr:1-deoxy-D-xylulose-5-phosphate synthase [Mycolicibacterium smegmatis MKD8]
MAEEIRRHLISEVTSTGGHLGPNLGVVELTIALHRIFDSPSDTLLFDTGHQTYVHKIVTGRGAQFPTLRQENGLSGYPSGSESSHDVIENSHASTALAYADGIAKARQLLGEQRRKVVAVVGDGALTGGMAWEALNNIGAAPDRPLILVLNDNGRSYTHTAGSLSQLLRGTRNGEGSAREFFCALGFRYIGPVDGHNIAQLEHALGDARASRRPIVVHVITTKGKGYALAEADEAECMHAIGAIDPATGAPRTPASTTWTDIFAQEITQLAAERPDIVAITAAMRDQVGLGSMAEEFPDRVFDVGIAEQHAICSAAGLALAGLHPVVAMYSTFLNRALDQVMMDVALHHLPVTIVLDRAGITGPDGPSHHGMWDTAILGAVPGLHIGCPRDAHQLRTLLREAVAMPAPTVVRYPKGSAGQPIPAVQRLGGCDLLSVDADADVLLIPVGPLAAQAVAAAEDLRRHGVRVTVVDPRWTCPITAELADLARQHRLVITVEDTITLGSLGHRLATELGGSSRTRIHTMALPTEFLPAASRSALLARHGLDSSRIVRDALALLRRADAETYT